MIESIDKNLKPKEVNLFNLVRDVKDWLLFIIHKWWLIAIISFCGGLIGFYVAYIERPKYEALLTFALDDNQGGLGGAINFAADLGLNIGDSKNIFEGDNILSLLISRTIVERVLLDTDTLNGKPISMANYYIAISKKQTQKEDTLGLSTAEKRIRNVSFAPGQPRNSFSYLQDSVLKNLYSSITKGGVLKIIKPEKKFNLYQVSVTTYNERFSKIFTDKLIYEAKKFYVEINSQKSKNTLELLEQRASEIRGSLNTSISSRASVQDANLNPAFQAAQAQIQRKQVDISVYGAAYQELYKNIELARYQYLKDIPLLQVIDPADYPMNRIKKGKLNTGVLYAIIASGILIVLLTLMHMVQIASQSQQSSSQVTHQ